MAVVALGDVEDHSMGVKLRRGVTVHRAGGVVLEGSRNEFAGRLRRVNIADAGLRVLLQLVERHADALPMRLSYALIAAHKGGERNTLGCAERRIPTGAMLHAGYFLAEFTLIGFGNLMTNKLRFRVRMLAFGQTREVLIANAAVQAPLLGQLALPFTMSLLVAAPIVLPLGRKLTLMVRPYLRSGQRFGDGQHRKILVPYSTNRLSRNHHYV